MAIYPDCPHRRVREALRRCAGGSGVRDNFTRERLRVDRDEVSLDRRASEPAKDEGAGRVRRRAWDGGVRADCLTEA